MSSSAPSVDPVGIVRNAVRQPVNTDFDPFSYVTDAYALVGMRTPLTRGIGTMGILYVLLNYFKPSFFFSGDQKRPWSLISDSPDAVLMNVEFVSIVAGIIAAGF